MILSHILEKEFIESKNYKPELKWFDGVWSRFIPHPVKTEEVLVVLIKKKLI